MSANHTNGTGRIRRHTVSVREPDGDPRRRRRASAADPYYHDDGGNDGDGEGWGTREDLEAVVRHAAQTPPGVELWGLEDGAMPLPRAARKDH